VFFLSPPGRQVIVTMVEVKVTDRNSFEKAMRIFKKQCQKEGFLLELKERRYYSKPSEKKRRKKSS
jgi:small subunit ribosomal protein S21